MRSLGCAARTAVHRLVLVVVIVTSGATLTRADTDSLDLTEYSLEDLVSVQVTSVSKKEERSNEVAAALTVITGDEIRRSGVTTIADALRQVPGLQVASINASSWAVSSRGFNSRFATKLLVLIDGRSVYTPLFSGVYWDVQDTLLEDIDRIEVIRGPGATIWGANAVNGVINIITKPAAETQGALLSAAAGNQERGLVTSRWGGRIGEDFHYRVYGKYFQRDGFQTSTGADALDDWDVLRTGFRSEWTPTQSDEITLQGGFYTGDATIGASILLSTPTATTDNADQELRGGNLLARWNHHFSETSDASVQAYYDRTERDTPLVNEDRNTIDFEFKHRFELFGRTEFIWGGGYRFTRDGIGNTLAVEFAPRDRTQHLIQAFVQNETRFFEDQLRFTGGIKIDHNDYTGFEFQPSVRAAWVPNASNTLWASISRAVRTPSRIDRDLTFRSRFVPAGTPGFPVDTFLGFVSTGSEISERVYAFEAGYRGSWREKVSIDVAAFFNDYNNLSSFDLATATLDMPPATFIGGFERGNDLRAKTYGVETEINWKVHPRLTLTATYAFLETEFDGSDATDPDAGLQEGFDPQHQVSLRSRLNLPWNLELDTTTYFVDNLNSQVTGAGAGRVANVPSYWRIDARLGWRPIESLELEIVGQNLLEQRHEEFPSEFGIVATEPQRSFFGRVTWRY